MNNTHLEFNVCKKYESLRSPYDKINFLNFIVESKNRNLFEEFCSNFTNIFIFENNFFVLEKLFKLIRIYKGILTVNVKSKYLKSDLFQLCKLFEFYKINCMKCDDLIPNPRFLITNILNIVPIFIKDNEILCKHPEVYLHYFSNDYFINSQRGALKVLNLPQRELIESEFLTYKFYLERFLGFLFQYKPRFIGFCFDFLSKTTNLVNSVVTLFLFSIIKQRFNKTEEKIGLKFAVKKSIEFIFRNSTLKTSYAGANMIFLEGVYYNFIDEVSPKNEFFGMIHTICNYKKPCISNERNKTLVFRENMMIEKIHILELLFKFFFCKKKDKINYNYSIIFKGLKTIFFNTDLYKNDILLRHLNHWVVNLINLSSNKLDNDDVRITPESSNLKLLDVNEEDIKNFNSMFGLIIKNEMKRNKTRGKWCDNSKFYDILFDSFKMILSKYSILDINELLDGAIMEKDENCLIMCIKILVFFLDRDKIIKSPNQKIKNIMNYTRVKFSNTNLVKWSHNLMFLYLIRTNKKDKETTILEIMNIIFKNNNLIKIGYDLALSIVFYYSTPNITFFSNLYRIINIGLSTGKFLIETLEIHSLILLKFGWDVVKKCLWNNKINLQEFLRFWCFTTNDVNHSLKKMVLFLATQMIPNGLFIHPFKKYKKWKDFVSQYENIEHGKLDLNLEIQYRKILTPLLNEFGGDVNKMLK